MFLCGLVVNRFLQIGQANGFFWSVEGGIVLCRIVGHLICDDLWWFVVVYLHTRVTFKIGSNLNSESDSKLEVFLAGKTWEIDLL